MFLQGKEEISVCLYGEGNPKLSSGTRTETKLKAGTLWM